VRALFDFHKVWGYVAIVANAIVGVLAIASSALMQQKFVREERETRESQ